MKELKDFIIEGAWGYEPSASDSAMDLIDKFKDDYVNYLGNKLSIAKDAQTSYDFIALVERWAAGLEPLGIYLNDSKIKNYVKAYQKAVKQCLADKKWLDTWNDPSAVRKELYTRDDRVKSIEDIIRIDEIMANIK